MPKTRDCLSFASFGQDVKAARLAMGMTRKALAEKVNIDPRYLAIIEGAIDGQSNPRKRRMRKCPSLLIYYIK